MRFRPGDLAALVHAGLRGNPGRLKDGLAPSETAGVTELALLAAPTHRKFLPGTAPGAVMLRASMAARCPVDCLVVTDPCCSLEQGVEIGAGTCIDRGTLADTLIGRGVKIDNQVQIAHNAQTGDYTAIAGCAGIGGSVRLGKHCRKGGGAGLAGPIDIADHVTITAMSLLNRSRTRLVFCGHSGTAHGALEARGAAPCRTGCNAPPAGGNGKAPGYHRPTTWR